MKKKTIKIQQISPELLLCFRKNTVPGKRIYHPEIESVSYGIISIQDKPDIHIVNGRELFAYPEDLILFKPGDIISSYSYGSNLSITFDLFKSDPGTVVHCDYIDEIGPHLIIKDNQKDEYTQLIREIFDCFEAEDDMLKLRSKALLTYLLHLLIQDNAEYGKEMIKCVEFIRENIESKVLIEQLADVTGLSRTHFHRVFKETFGVTPIDYINSEKMKFARHILKKNGMSTVEAAKRLGFGSDSYFRELFRAEYGITPNQYISKILNI